MKKSILFKMLIISSILIAAGYLFTSVLFFSAKNTQISCNNLNISILIEKEMKMLSEKQVSDFLLNSLLNPLGKQESELHISKMEKELGQNPLVRRVECYLTPSGVLNVSIHQRVPKFRVMPTATESYYVDTERKIFPVSTSCAVFLPLVSGNLSQTFACGKLFDFVSYLENHNFWNAQIEQIYILDNQQIELIPRVGSGVILLGDIADFEKKLQKLQKLYTDAFNQIGWNRYKTIDLRYKNQVVCTRIDGLN